MKKIIIIITALLVSTNCLAQKNLLELTLTQGQTYTYHINMEMALKQNVNELDMNLKTTTNSTINYKVLAKVDSIYEIEVSYTDLKLKMEMPNGVQEFDTNKKDTTDMVAKLMSAMRKNSFLIKVTKSGNVTEVKNTENLFKAIDDFKDIDAIQKTQLKAMLMQTYGEKAFKENMKSSMIIFPTIPIAVGEQWVVKSSIESGVATGIETTYTLKEVTGEDYIITGLSKIASLNKDKYTEQGGMEMRSDLAGTMNTTYKLNKKTGWLINGNSTMQIKGTTYVKESDALPTGMTLLMEIKNTSTITGN